MNSLKRAASKAAGRAALRMWHARSFVKDLSYGSSREIDHESRLAFEGLLNSLFGGLLFWIVLRLAGAALGWW